MFTIISHRSESPSLSDTSKNDDATRTRGVQDILVRDVASRFKRITGEYVVITPAWNNLSERKNAVREWANHPDCRPNKKSRACMRCRLGHLRFLSQTASQATRHRCPFGRICAVTPLLIDGHCEAHCKLSLDVRTTDASIERYLELLEILAENVGAHMSHSVAAPISGEEARGDMPRATSRAFDADTDSWSTTVEEAIHLVDSHFADPDLTVSTIARHMGLNRDYLSHLFRIQTGQRMSRRIFLRRMQHARELLRTTSLQVRQVALASGFLNTDWFSHTFHELEGITPSQYRRQSRGNAQ